MPILAPGQPITVREPHLLVENRFAPGRYRFQLVVIDEAGLESGPAELVVAVREPVRPPPTRPTGPVINPDIFDVLRPGRPDLREIRPDRIRPIRRPP